MTASVEFDAIVIGSGITGGWAAKELTERGLRVLMIERGPAIEHGTDYTTETLAPWQLPFRGFGDPAVLQRDYPVQSMGASFDEWTQAHFVNDRDHPYQSGGPKPFQWRRGYQLGGRSLTWGRHCYRWSDLDFDANRRDGHGIDWPIRYADLAPWYDHVESFVGVSGSEEGLAHLPDGKFQPPMQLNAVERAAKTLIERAFPGRRLIIGRVANLTQAKEDEGRAPCQYRDICARGCSYGAYFSTQSSTLPAARKTGRLTVVTDSVVESFDFDATTRKISAVRTLEGIARLPKTYTARLYFLCAGSVNSVGTLLRSGRRAQQEGFCNSSGALGHYFMDHATTMTVVADIPGFDEHSYYGNRPNNLIIPRFQNLTEPNGLFLRGYSFQGGASRTAWQRGAKRAGIGQKLKADLQSPGPWRIILRAYAECLPRPENRISIDDHNRDGQGLPQMRIDFSHGENERRLLEHAEAEALSMLALTNAKIVRSSREPDAGGSAVHEMGGARMGDDPRVSVLDRWNRAHDAQNLFVTDGAAMNSTACQNPSLTYMALTARAASHAVGLLKAGVI